MSPPPLETATASPLFGVLLTLAAYRLALWIQRRTGWRIAQPVLLGTLLTVGGLWLADLEYATYRDASSPLWWLLGPATVALAVPLHLNLARIRTLLWPLLAAIGTGSAVGLALTLLLAHLLGADTALLVSLAPKSATSPIAISLADSLGGWPALTAVFVMVTGVAGAMLGPPLLRLAGVELCAARGVALGLSAHAVGTAQALQESEECGAFAALAMSLSGAITALLLPLLLGPLLGAGPTLGTG